MPVNGNRPQRIGVAVLVVAAHVGGLGLLTHLASRPVVIPERDRVTLALIPAEPSVPPAAPAPPQPQPAPPNPQVQPKPAPGTVPKPLAKPSSKPTTPKPEPKLTESPTALQQAAPDPAPAAAADPTPPTVHTAAPVAVPAASSPAAASAPSGSAPITAARFDAAYLNNPAPTYPMLSRRLREEGQVMLRVLVSPDGRPNRIELRTSSGIDRLDQAAQDAVARWRFVPARQGETAVEAWVLVPIVFKLKGN